MFDPEFLAEQNPITRQFLEEHAADYEANKSDPRWIAEKMQPGWLPIILPHARAGHAGRQNPDGTWRVLCRSPKATIPPPSSETTDDTWRVTCVSCRAKLGIRSIKEH
jgi:hypothetical protein